MPVETVRCPRAGSRSSRLRAGRSTIRRSRPCRPGWRVRPPIIPWDRTQISIGMARVQLTGARESLDPPWRGRRGNRRDGVDGIAVRSLLQQRESLAIEWRQARQVVEPQRDAFPLPPFAALLARAAEDLAGEAVRMNRRIDHVGDLVREVAGGIAPLRRCPDRLDETLPRRMGIAIRPSGLKLR